MPIEFACESCHRLLRVPDGSVGAACRCPACESIVSVPDPAEIREIVGVSQGQVEFDQGVLIACPKCHHELKGDRALVGTKGQCRQCGCIFMITERSGRPAAVEALTPQFTFNCPKCRQLFEGQPEMEGRKGRCHVCQEVFVIHLQRAAAPSQSTAAVDEATTAERSSSVRTPVETRSPGEATRDGKRRIEVRCPACTKRLSVSGQSLGQTVRCPACKNQLRIPAIEPPLPSPAPSATPVPSEASVSGQGVSEGDESASSNLFTDLGHLAEGHPGNDAAGDLGNPYRAIDTQSGPRGWADWTAESSTASKPAVTLVSALQLAFQQLIPNCIISSLVYFGWYALGVLVFYGGLLGLGFAAAALELTPGTVQVLVSLAMFLLGAVMVVCVTTGVAMMINGALRAVRRKKVEFGMLADASYAVNYFGFMLVVGLINGLVAGILMLVASMVGEQMPLLVVVFAAPVMVGYLLFLAMISLAPIAIADGYGVFTAIGRSIQVFRRYPWFMIGLVLSTILIMVALGAVTCGAGAILWGALPFYILAAAYHLATRQLPSH
ncbi:MAG: hypothetical protein KatS3mg111_1795 [Pirellulaceae bacterium]|nr:MAG: hypothetical protein KatS3mg111_1795 [Pirellulaceae bacterium]